MRVQLRRAGSCLPLPVLDSVQAGRDAHAEHTLVELVEHGKRLLGGTIIAVARNGCRKPGARAMVAADEVLAGFHELKVAMLWLGNSASLNTIFSWRGLAAADRPALDPPYQQEYVGRSQLGNGRGSPRRQL